MIFNKRKFKDKIGSLTNRIKELEEEVERQKRIIKYSKDKTPSCRFEFNPYTCDDLVYAYIDGEEYCAALEELDNDNVIVKEGTCEFKVESNIVYFTCEAFGCNFETYKYKFAIDFKRRNHSVRKRIIKY